MDNVIITPTIHSFFINLPCDNQDCIFSWVSYLFITTILIFVIITSLFLKNKAHKIYKNNSLIKQKKPEHPIQTDFSSPANSTQQTRTAIDNLTNDLGQYETIKFLGLCIQELTRTRKTIDQHLNSHDINNAKIIIHKLVGTSNLYASMNLRQLLINIDDDRLAEEDLEQALIEVQIELSFVLDCMNERQLSIIDRFQKALKIPKAQ